MPTSFINIANRSRVLNGFYSASFAIMSMLCLQYAVLAKPADIPAKIFVALVWATYSFIYLIPALIVGRTGFFIEKLATKKAVGPSWSGTAVYAVAASATAVSEMAIVTDIVVYRMYGFHLNGFVLNLLVTPGGLDSLGGSASAKISVALAAAGIVAFNLFLVFIAHRLIFRKTGKESTLKFPVLRYLLALFLIATASERIMYGVSHFQAYAPVVTTANAFPFYLPLTLKSLGRKFGFEPRRNPAVEVQISGGGLNYPRNDLSFTKAGKRYNIVWLTAESWRWDMLDPDIMPETWKFARTSANFVNHYSGGIGTRMGIFSMFYGLDGPYWFPFLERRKSPVFVDVLQKLGYQVSMYTSAKFSYPEFDKTVFSKLEKDELHEYSEEHGWKSDRKNVGDLLEFIRNRDPAKPFMTFMFFESPHARYYFPEECAIRKPYLEDFNYVSGSLEEEMPLIFNRYVNSCRHLDSQFARVIDLLKEENLLEDTIVVITGDHGEEFMEKGRWGHNSEFHEEQVRVPLIVHVPGAPPRVVDHMTSHVDLPATILPLLGVGNPPEDYCEGQNLFDGNGREYVLATDWSRICYISEFVKTTFPYKTSGFFQNETTSKDDRPLPKAAKDADFAASTLRDIMERLSRFRAKASG